MMNIFSLLSDSTTEVVSSAFKRFTTIVNIILPVLMSVLLVLGMFYGITIGVKYAKAEEEDDKKKLKGQLISVIVGVCIAIISIAIIQILLNADFVKKTFDKTALENAGAGI